MQFLFVCFCINYKRDFLLSRATALLLQFIKEPSSNLKTSKQDDTQVLKSDIYPGIEPTTLRSLILVIKLLDVTLSFAVHLTKLTCRLCEKS
jgi:hypothetical protein